MAARLSHVGCLSKHQDIIVMLALWALDHFTKPPTALEITGTEQTATSVVTGGALPPHGKGDRRSDAALQLNRWQDETSTYQVPGTVSGSNRDRDKPTVTLSSE